MKEPFKMIAYLIIKLNSIFHHANQREKYGLCNCILVHKYWIQSSHAWPMGTKGPFWKNGGQYCPFNRNQPTSSIQFTKKKAAGSINWTEWLNCRPDSSVSISGPVLILWRFVKDRRPSPSPIHFPTPEIEGVARGRVGGDYGLRRSDQILYRLHSPGNEGVASLLNFFFCSSSVAF